MFADTFILKYESNMQVHTFDTYGESGVPKMRNIALQLAELFARVTIEVYSEGKLVQETVVLPQKPIASVINTEGYAYYGANMGPNMKGKPNHRQRYKLQVSFILDSVAGAFHEPEDLMKWIAANPYVDTVSLMKS